MDGIIIIRFWAFILSTSSIGIQTFPRTWLGMPLKNLWWDCRREKAQMRGSMVTAWRVCMVRGQDREAGGSVLRQQEEDPA